MLNELWILDFDTVVNKL